jgi:hypothetical protein
MSIQLVPVTPGTCHVVPVPTTPGYCHIVPVPCRVNPPRVLQYTCDGCSVAPISGPIYHCSACGTYDLCSVCYLSEKIHVDHRSQFRKLPETRACVYNCDGCSIPIRTGTVFHCRDCTHKGGFDFCASCNTAASEAKSHHGGKHTFVEVPVVTSAATP